MMNRKMDILVVSKNTTGFIPRVMTLFQKRGYTIHKINANLTDVSGYAKVTFSLEGNFEILEQLKKQVYKIVDVVNVQQI